VTLWTATVYGVFSLLCDADTKLAIEADYSKPVSEVYTDIVRNIIDKRCSLKILETCELSSKVLNIPSWVPDWSSPIKQLNLPWGTWSACGWISAQFQFLQPDMLRVAGVRSSRISKVSVVHSGDYDSDISHEDFVCLLRNLKPVDNLDAPYKSGGKIIEAYAHILTGMGFAHHFDPPDPYWPDFEQTVKDLRTVWTTNNTYNELKRDSRHLFEAFYRACTLNIIGRRIFTTENGLVGLAPLGTRENDSICVLLGCRLPVVLRETFIPSVANRTYEVVGMCYVPGLMMGEIIHGGFSACYRPLNKFGRVMKTLPIDSLHVGLLDARTNELKTDPSAILREMGIRCEKYERYPHVLEVTPEVLRGVGVDLEDFDLI